MKNKIIIDSMFELSHYKLDEELKPSYFDVKEICDEYGLSINEAIDIAKESGYNVYKFNENYLERPLVIISCPELTKENVLEDINAYASIFNIDEKSNGSFNEALNEEVIYGLYMNDREKPLEVGSKQEMEEIKRHLQDVSPIDTHGKLNKYKVKLIGQTSWESLEEDGLDLEFVNAKHLANIYDKEGNLIETKIFQTRPQLDRYLEKYNIYDMSSIKDIVDYKNKKFMGSVWTVIVELSKEESLKEEVLDEQLKNNNVKELLINLLQNENIEDGTYTFGIVSDITNATKDANYNNAVKQLQSEKYLDCDGAWIDLSGTLQYEGSIIIKDVTTSHVLKLGLSLKQQEVIWFSITKSGENYVLDARRYGSVDKNFTRYLKITKTNVVLIESQIPSGNGFTQLKYNGFKFSFALYGKKYSLEEAIENHDELKAKIKKIVDKYKEEQDSKLSILEVEPGNDAFIKHYDNEDVDFGPFTYHPEGEHEDENGTTPALITFTLTGGLNGWGELSNWGLYLENISKLFKELEQETGLHIEIQDIENDIPDDVWTAQVLMYKKDTNLEESLNRLIESLSNHFNKDLEEDIDTSTSIAKKIAKKLNLSKEDYNMLLHDINNLRGDEWLEQVKSIGDEELLNKFKSVAQIEDLVEDIEKHDTLNPKLFEDNKLKPEIREAILKIVDTFIDDLELYGVKLNVKDIVFVGSNASYNYTKDSDMDVHIIASKEGLECPDNLYPLLYSAYSSIFNKNYDIKIKGIDAELYVEVDEPVISNGIYSVLNDEWVKEPVQKDIPDLDEEAFDKLFNEWEDKYFDLLDDEELTSSKIKEFIGFIYDLRKTGIAQEGEYSLGNLVFKEFRNLGYLDNLKELRKVVKGKELSLESVDTSSKDDIIKEGSEDSTMNDDIVYGYKVPSDMAGYYKVEFFDDDGRCLNHWLSGNQIQYFKNREDAVKYIDEVRSWNVFRFTQTLISKIR